MTVKKHNGDFGTGSIVGYTSYSGTTLYAYKLVQEVWVDAVGEYRWITQYGKVVLSENKFTPDAEGKTFYLFSDKEIKDGYPEVWTKTVGDDFKKGDILEGEDSYGMRVVFLYESKDLVHRLTPYNGSPKDVSWAGIDTYKSQVKNLRLVRTASYGNQRFSEI